ncbi:Uncharacterised protein [Bordetella pertussis]|nr:Uncharacterised protein [Bordetella pertussis]CFW46805.1 Uncharacterised protein [Bordetella pertussis]
MAICSQAVTSRRKSPRPSPLLANSRTSPPAQKCLPAPRNSTTRTSGSRWQRITASWKAFINSIFMPLAASGRFNVMRATWSA